MKPFTLAHLTLSAPPAESIAAAHAAGFPAVGIRITARRPEEAYPVRVIGAPDTVRAIRRRAQQAGVRLANLAAYQFYPDTRWEDVRPVVTTAHELGVPTIVAYSFDPDEGRFLDIFARYCEEARSAGIRIALEFLPYSAIRDLNGALDAIDRSGVTNAGVIVDVLHLARSGGLPRDVHEVDPKRIAYVQICDARQHDRPLTDAELMSEARTARMAPGEGVLPLFELLDGLADDVEIEYEVAPAERAAWSPLRKALAARADADRFVRAYDSHRQTTQLSAR